MVSRLVVLRLENKRLDAQPLLPASPTQVCQVNARGAMQYFLTLLKRALHLTNAYTYIFLDQYKSMWLVWRQ